METLDQALAEVNRVSDKMVEHLIWCNRERSTKIQEMANSGHVESKALIANFLVWHTLLHMGSASFVEVSEGMIAQFSTYRAANHIE